MYKKPTFVYHLFISLRFLTRLTDRQFCLISENDLEGFAWNLTSNSGKQTLDEGANHKIKEQKREKVSIKNGFEVIK